MESPFGFIMGFQMEREAKSRADGRLSYAEDRKKEQMTNWELPTELATKMDKLEKHEKVIEEKIDVVA